MRKMNTAPDPPSVKKRPESSSRWGRRPRYLPFAMVYCSFDIRENKLRVLENFFGVACVNQLRLGKRVGATFQDTGKSGKEVMWAEENLITR